MPGIGRVEDEVFLGTLKSMNKVILNPAFFLVFFGSVIMNLINPILLRNQASSKVILLLIVAAGIYLVGMFFVTLFGNIPLNRLLEGSSLETLSSGQLQVLRTRIEQPWKTYNWIRTLSSLAAFVLLVVAGYHYVSENPLPPSN